MIFILILLIEIIFLIILIIISALVSASETALTSMSKLRIKHLINERGDKALNLNIWLTNPARILTIILILNNIVNITASSLTTIISINYFPDINISIGVGIITFIILVCGEIVPKNIGRRYPEQISIFAIKPLDSLAQALSPIVKFMIQISDFIIRAFRLPPGEYPEVITQQEIKMMIDIGHKEGIVEPFEREMIHRIFRFNDTTVSAVMTPRNKMICGQINMDINKLLDLITIEGHSRIPIYDDSIDNIIGIIHDRDILYCIKENHLININDCLREPFKVFEHIMIDDLLHEFQQK
ncbi:MAG: HlyC/CorC family transporter, partial [Candidatus Firestonebacteria bacterium]|nr:HlyC/CorC family transporter [Candidatus Firestonebacteria bacterium]